MVRGVHDARVDGPQLLEAEERCSVLGALEDEGGGGVDGRRAGAVVRVGGLAMMEHDGVELGAARPVGVVVARRLRPVPVRGVRRHGQHRPGEKHLSNPVGEEEMRVAAPTVQRGLGGIVLRVVVDGQLDGLPQRNVAVVLLFQGRRVVLQVVEHVERSVPGILHEAKARRGRVALHAKAGVGGQVRLVALPPAAHWHEELVGEAAEERGAWSKVLVAGASKGLLV
mmetsp:Transcript_118489/g.347082  ORF Transcript_118489/g.347082 Transcript_118489/m.347082 type:complete len:226 (-) Transcript_118489:115-792(-)